jgi:hypothetical protein
LVVALAVFVMLITLFALSNYYFDPDMQKPPMREAARALASQLRAGDTIAHTSDSSALAFVYYTPDVPSHFLAGDPDYIAPTTRGQTGRVAGLVPEDLGAITAKPSRLGVLHWTICRVPKSTHCGSRNNSMTEFAINWRHLFILFRAGSQNESCFATLDVVLVLALTGAFLASTFEPTVWTALVIIVLVCYLLVHIFLPAHVADRIKWMLVWVIIAAAAVETLMAFVILRHLTAPYQFVHDGVIQTEEAIKFFLQGKNPYAENYLNTPMALWGYGNQSSVSISAALYHFAYWPFLILFSAPFYLLAQGTLGWFDQRMLYLLMYIFTLMLLPQFARSREKVFALILFVGLQPLFFPYFTQGRNDIFVLFWLVLCLVFLKKQRWLSAFVVLAFACATKPTAWFAIPFCVIYLLGRGGFSRPRMFTLPLAAFVGVMAVVVLPFFFWDPYSFVDDVWNYTAGTSTYSYPISTFGFGSVALSLGLIHDKAAQFPFWMLQIVFGMPALFLLCRYQVAHNNLRTVWLGYAFLTLVVSFFSRVFNDNHVGFVISLFAIGLMTDDNTLDQSPQTSAANSLADGRLVQNE